MATSAARVGKVQAKVFWSRHHRNHGHLLTWHGKKLANFAKPLTYEAIFGWWSCRCGFRFFYRENPYRNPD